MLPIVILKTVSRQNYRITLVGHITSPAFNLSYDDNAEDEHYNLIKLLFAFNKKISKSCFIVFLLPAYPL
jgi:hypothetical protein